MKSLHNYLYMCFRTPIGKCHRSLQNIHPNRYSHIRYFHCNFRYYFHYILLHHYMKTYALQMRSKMYHILSMLLLQLLVKHLLQPS